MTGKNNDSNEIEIIRSEIESYRKRVSEITEMAKKASKGEVDDILKFNNDYAQIISDIENTGNRIIKLDPNSNLLDETDSLFDDLNFIYDSARIPINNAIVNKTQELEDAYRKTQGVQLAVFSIVLSILAFILTNAKILAAEKIDFKNVLLVNLSFILSTNVLFSFIYLFMGPVFSNNKGFIKILRYFIVFAMPVCLVVALILISIFMK